MSALLLSLAMSAEARDLSAVCELSSSICQRRHAARAAARCDESDIAFLAACQLYLAVVRETTRDLQNFLLRGLRTRAQVGAAGLHAFDQQVCCTLRHVARNFGQPGRAHALVRTCQ